MDVAAAGRDDRCAGKRERDDQGETEARHGYIVLVFARAAGIAGLAALIVACGGPATSPFSLWRMRPGMPFDSVERLVLFHADLRQSVEVWDRCEPLDAGARRCERALDSPWGRLQVVVTSDGKVPYLAFAPPTPREESVDDSIQVMSRQWGRAKGVRMDWHGVSESSPWGVAEMRSGRWRAFLTFDGKRCQDSARFCASLIQLVDWQAGRKYADMSTPH